MWSVIQITFMLKFTMEIYAIRSKPYLSGSGEYKPFATADTNAGETTTDGCVIPATTG